MAARIVDVLEHPVPASPVVSLQDLIRRAVEHCRPQFQARFQHLHIEALCAPIDVRGDADAMTETLAGMLCEASEAAALDGELSLSIRQVGDKVRLRVHAQTAARTRESEGEFSLTLLAAGHEARPTGGPLIAGFDAPRAHVLVVDDSQDSADSVACMLSLRGYEVSVAYDGLHALEMALRLRPDIVVLDMELPGIDGPTVAERMRSAGDYSPALIVLSGYGADFDRLRPVNCDEHFTKPVDPEALLQAVARHVPAAAATA